MVSEVTPSNGGRLLRLSSEFSVKNNTAHCIQLLAKSSSCRYVGVCVSVCVCLSVCVCVCVSVCGYEGVPVCVGACVDVRVSLLVCRCVTVGWCLCVWGREG